jgi:membrane protease YdiL (CAAX protease family)
MILRPSHQPTPMPHFAQLWGRLPVIVRAAVAGLAVAALGTVPWALVVGANLKHLSGIPWSVPIMAGYLVLYWAYFVRGAGWPRSTSATRRTAARANSVLGDAWGIALLAGMLGLVSILLLQGVMSRLVRLPTQRDIDPSQYPVGTVFLWVVMSAIVAGVVEETGFRGYLQRPIEKRHGPVVAILITGVVFGFIHFSHAEVGLTLLPFYMAVAAVYGSLAYFTDSTLPSMMLHAGGNIFSAFGLFAQGKSEWQLSAAQPKLLWETGLDASFIGNAVALAVFSALTVWAFAGLASSVSPSRWRSSPAPPSGG